VNILFRRPCGREEYPRNDSYDHASHGNGIWRDVTGGEKGGQFLPHLAIAAGNGAPIRWVVNLGYHAHFPIKNMPVTSKTIPARFTGLIGVPEAAREMSAAQMKVLA